MSSNIKSSRRNLYDEHRKGAFEDASDDDVDDRASVAIGRRPQQTPITRIAERDERDRRVLEQENLKDDYLEDHEKLLNDDEEDDRASTWRPKAGTGKAVVNNAKIYIGNLPFTSIKTDLESLFGRVR
jgi:hypothetical protein